MSSTGHQSRALYVPERLTNGGCGNIKFQPFPRFMLPHCGLIWHPTVPVRRYDATGTGTGTR